MSMLTIIQDATDKVLTAPSPRSVKGSADDTIRQMVSLLNEEGQALAMRYQWQALTRRVTKDAEPGEDQGGLETLAPGFAYIVNDTVWLSDMPFKPSGPLTQQQRSGLEAWKVGGAVWSYWIEGNHLYISRPPEKKQLLMFRYQSRNWAVDVEGLEKSRMENDSDTAILPEGVLTLGVVWRWLQRNGLPYEQEYINYDSLLNQFIAKEGTRAKLIITETYGYAPNGSLPGGVMRV